MAMRKYSSQITICETIRRINDLCQGDTERDSHIRDLCATAEYMAKRMQQKLIEYKGDFTKDGFFKPNDKFQKDRDAGERTRSTYKVGNILDF